MFTKTVKKTICTALLGSFALGAIVPALARAETDHSRLSGLERQELAVSSVPGIEMTTDQAKDLIIETNIGLIKYATGVDVKTLPFVSKLFPKEDSINYDRIAADTSRIVKEAFRENSIFEQQSYLAGAIKTLSRIATATKYSDKMVVTHMKDFDVIMDRTARPDLRESAAGYWASAAQMSLNAMGMRVAHDQQNKLLKEELADSARAYRHTVGKLAQDLRELAEKAREKQLGRCNWVYTDGGRGSWVEYQDHLEKKLKKFPTDAACEADRNANIKQGAHGVVYLEKLADKWMDLEVATRGGEHGLKSYEALKAPKTQEAMGGKQAFNLTEVRHNFEVYVASGGVERHGSVCKTIEESTIKGQMERRLPKDHTQLTKLLGLVGC